MERMSRITAKIAMVRMITYAADAPGDVACLTGATGNAASGVLSPFDCDRLGPD